MIIDRPTLNRSIMDRYEITEHRPTALRAVLFGADELMLGGTARVLHKAQTGVLCVTEKAEALQAQDGMYTVLERGASLEKSRESVVQSILCAVDPEKDFDEFLMYAEKYNIEALFCHADGSAVEYALVLRFICQMRKSGRSLPGLFAVSDLPELHCDRHIREVFKQISGSWGDMAFIDELEIIPVICDGLFGILSSSEAERQQESMNYTDNFLMWAQPEVLLKAENVALYGITSIEDVEKELKLKASTDAVLEFICAAGGYLSGENTFAAVLGDDLLRKWIAHAWFDEIMPQLPNETCYRTRVINAFEKYEDSHNDVLLMSSYGLIRRLPRTLLPIVKSYAKQMFEAPVLSTLAIAAVIMLYSGARSGENGYEVRREDRTDILMDDRNVLEAFAQLDRDMPAESLTYAALADRTVWNMDLRDVDGLETAVMNDISAIQRIGFKETLKYILEDIR